MSPCFTSCFLNGLARANPHTDTRRHREAAVINQGAFTLMRGVHGTVLQLMLHLLSNCLYKAQGLLTLGFINSMDRHDERSLFPLPSPPCCRNELHAIVDEVYMLTVFEESVSFCSVLSIDRYIFIVNVCAGTVCMITPSGTQSQQRRLTIAT